MNGNFYDPINGEISGKLNNGNGQKIKQYNYYDKLMFEGEYSEGKMWNGKFFNPEENEQSSGTLINGNGQTRQ